MAGQVYALVVGVQRYDQVSALRGPERDMRYVFGLLQEKLAVPRDHIIPLLDGSATYQRLIEGFETLIEKVGPGDTAFFYFSGHGARCKSAPEFQHLSGDGYDETLVCVDSRIDNTPDLSDKELAWFASRITQKGGECVFLLDCCHAGGITRSHGMPGAIKQVKAKDQERSLEAYYGNWTPGLPNDLPDRRLLSIGACNRFQLAREYGRADKGGDKLNRGVLTLALEEALEEGIETSYPDLFVRIRAATMAYNPSQIPQMDHWGGFIPQRNFLQTAVLPGIPTYDITYREALENGPPAGWWLNLGVAAGLIPGKIGQISLLDEAGHELQTALVSKVGLEQSFLQVSRPDLLDPRQTYQASLEGIPADPLLLGVEGDPEAVATLLKAWHLHPYPLVQLSSDHRHPQYTLLAKEGEWQFIHRIKEKVLFTAHLDDLADRLRRVANWERLASLQSPTGPHQGQLDFKIQRDQDQESALFHTKTDLITPPLPGKPFQRFRIYLRNQSDQPLHWYFFHLGEGFAITPRGQGLLPQHSEWAMAHRITLGLVEGAYSFADRLKLLCSPFPIDAFQLVQAAVPAEVYRSADLYGTLDLKSWNAIDFNLNTALPLGEKTGEHRLLAGGNLILDFPPGLAADVQLWSSSPLHDGPASAPLPTDFLRNCGLKSISFLPGDQAHYQLIGLHFKQIPDLEAIPVSITLQMGQGSRKRLWPLAWNGNELFVAGRPEGDGKVLLTHLRDGGPSWRAGGGKDFKICLFEISDQTLNLEGMAGPELADTLHQLY